MRSPFLLAALFGGFQLGMAVPQSSDDPSYRLYNVPDVMPDGESENCIYEELRDLWV